MSPCIDVHNFLEFLALQEILRNKFLQDVAVEATRTSPFSFSRMIVEFDMFIK